MDVGQIMGNRIEQIDSAFALSTVPTDTLSNNLLLIYLVAVLLPATVYMLRGGKPESGLLLSFLASLMIMSFLFSPAGIYIEVKLLFGKIGPKRV